MGIFNRLSGLILGQDNESRKDGKKLPENVKSLRLAKNNKEPVPKFQGNSKQRRKQRRAWERQQMKAKGIQDDPEC